MFLHLNWSHLWLKDTPVYIRSHNSQCISEPKPGHEEKRTAGRAQDCVEAQIWRRLKKNSAALKDPRSTAASILLNGRNSEPPGLFLELANSPN
ncbi:hypothetical protein GDO78_011755 [Eleutherodactylus coqui]|uniref:Uncharacterized protein n=1 Tax=Eleutherodactylus coqui TaxID=57060 RepID=A0A8J6F1A8_ELECQ|nr:hypothetical protein GDO78_011755 [Eleutherodactylus coqui]